MPGLLQIETRSSEPLAVGNTTLTRFARSVRLRFPGLSGGLIWNRPVSVLVQTAGGQEQIVAVPDVTRQLQAALWGASLFSVLFMWLIFRKIGKSKKQEVIK